MPKPAPANTIGLTAIGSYSSSVNPTHLTQQLDDAGVSYETVQLPLIVGTGGNAYLINYTSPRSGGPITVLVVPDQHDVDQHGETYFNFQGMSLSEATAGDFHARWGDLYDRCLPLAAVTDRPWRLAIRALTYGDLVPGAVVIEDLNGVRYRVTGIDGESVHTVPIDNPLPVPRGNATGRRPSRWHRDNICGNHLLLTDPELIALDSAAYAARIGMESPRIQWVPYDPGA